MRGIEWYYKRSIVASKYRFFFEQYNFPQRSKHKRKNEKLNKSDSPWGLVYNLSQVTGIPVYDVLYKWSFENILLFSRATPSYDVEEEKKEKEWDERLDANNPDNFKNDADIIYE